MRDDKPELFWRATVDHKIPLSKGGGNHITNLVAACYDCNSSKDNTTKIKQPSLYVEIICNGSLIINRGYPKLDQRSLSGLIKRLTFKYQESFYIDYYDTTQS